jgi:flagellar biosynthetic protein FliR
MTWDFLNWMLVFVRAGAFFSILPIFTMLNIPVQFRVMMAALLGVLIAPTLPPFPFAQLTLFDWVWLFAREMSYGVLLGFVTRMVFYASDFAGQLVANELGLNLASVFDPSSGQPSQAPAFIMFLLTCIMMMSLDMHHWLITGFQYTYALAPIGGQQLREGLFTLIVDHTARVFLIGLQIAGPLIAASFLVMLLIGFLGRLVPQMNVFAESFSVRLACGLAVLAFTLQISAQHILNCLRRLPEDMIRVAQAMGLG